VSSNSITNESDTFEIGDSTVHRLGFGAMRLTGENIIGAPADEETAREVVKHAVDCGVDLIDTADSYGPAASERLIGEAIGDPDDVLVATKAGLLRNSEGDWIAHGDPDYIRNQVLTSLDRLQTDTIDLFQFHRPDDDTPYADSVATFAELKDEGLVDSVGVSNVSAELLDQAREQVEIETVQNRYNLNDRGVGRSSRSVTTRASASSRGPRSTATIWTNTATSSTKSPTHTMPRDDRSG